jgi:hypothetical protein
MDNVNKWILNKPQRTEGDGIKQASIATVLAALRRRGYKCTGASNVNTDLKIALCIRCLSTCFRSNKSIKVTLST